MPQPVSQVNIFVAASSDVAEERDALKQVVGKLDERYHRWRLDLQVINWDSHVIPDIGTDPQDVINRQVRFDAIDIFIGIIWERIGTATPRAISGTVEELNRALASRQQTGRPWHIMFFLCDRSGSFKSGDAFQAEEAAKFKQWIERSAICKHYTDLQVFTDQASDALSMALDGFLQNRPQSQLPPQPQPLPVQCAFADPYGMGLVIVCPWCANFGPVGTIPTAQYPMYKGRILHCPRCAMPHFFP